VVFGGESGMVGQGLAWSETIPAQVEALTGIQSANIAVHGFASDQVYRRLMNELPRFSQPVAVVIPFMPAIFDRNLDDDRPHLAPDLTPLPPVSHWRLTAIAHHLAPYRSEATLARGIATTRAVLRATVELARARGATALIVVPRFGAEGPEERALREQLLDGAGLRYVVVDLDPSWRLPNDLHPDASAAHAIAVAVAAHLHDRQD